jgi:predicted kinase
MEPEPEKKKRKCKIIVNIGLPGSGKTTDTKAFLEIHGDAMRVNRDEIRRMLFHKWQGHKEKVVTQIESAAIRSIILSGFDAIVDDTNLNPSTISKWKDLALELDVPLVEKHYETPIETCILRDSLRAGREKVGRAVIEGMALNYGLFPPLPADKKVVIFDVDGTLADQTQRQKFIATKPKDYHSFYSYGNLLCDKPRDTIVSWAQNCHLDYMVIIVSGRPSDKACNATTDWLKMYGVEYDHLFMRAGGDFRDDTIIKQEILDKILKWIPKEQILFAVDDRPRVIRMWRENGICVYDVGEGIEF